MSEAGSRSPSGKPTTTSRDAAPAEQSATRQGSEGSESKAAASDEDVEDRLAEGQPPAARRQDSQRMQDLPAMCIQIEASPAGKTIVGHKKQLHKLAPAYHDKVENVVQSKNKVLINTHVGELERASRHLRQTEIQIEDRNAATIWGIAPDSSLFPKARTLNTQLEEAKNQVARLKETCEALTAEISVWRQKALERESKNAGSASVAHVALRRNRLLHAASQQLGPEHDDVDSLTRIAKERTIGDAKMQQLGYGTMSSSASSGAAEDGEKDQELQPQELKFSGLLQGLMGKLGHEDAQRVQEALTKAKESVGKNTGQHVSQLRSKRTTALPPVPLHTEAPESFRLIANARSARRTSSKQPQSARTARSAGAGNSFQAAADAEEAANAARDLANRYEESIAELEEQLAVAKQDVARLRGPCASALCRKSSYEDFFLTCMNDARSELRRKVSVEAAAQASGPGTPASSPRFPPKPPPPPVRWSDSDRVLQMLLGNEDVIIGLYEKLFRRGRAHKPARKTKHGVGSGSAATATPFISRSFGSYADERSSFEPSAIHSMPSKPEHVLDWYLNEAVTSVGRR